jgi:hypothetical protein
MRKTDNVTYLFSIHVQEYIAVLIQIYNLWFAHTGEYSLADIDITLG